MMLLVTPSISPSLSLSAILSFISCLFLTWALSGRGADLIREWATWIGGICVASTLALGWPDAFSGNSSFNAAHPDQLRHSSQPHTQSRAQCQAMDYLTECTVWRLPLFPGKPTACRLLALFWFERGQNTRCFWPTLPVSSGYRPQLRASTLHIRKNSKRARAKATASCTSGWQCLCLGWTRVKFYHSFPALLSFASSWCCC